MLVLAEAIGMTSESYETLVQFLYGSAGDGREPRDPEAIRHAAEQFLEEEHPEKLKLVVGVQLRKRAHDTDIPSLQEIGLHLVQAAIPTPVLEALEAYEQAQDPRLSEREEADLLDRFHGLLRDGVAGNDGEARRIALGIEMAYKLSMRVTGGTAR